VLALTLLLHALFALVLWNEMRAKPPQPVLAHANIDQVLVVRLLDDSGTPRAPQPPAPPTPPAVPSPRPVIPHARPVTHEKPRRDAMVVQDHAAAPVPATSVATPATSSVFAKDGSVRLPPTAANNWAPGTKARPAKSADDRRIMQHDLNRMHTKHTRFEKYFPPPDETAGGALGRHIGDALKKIAKSVCDPKKSSTASNMLCAAPPLPPSPKDRDERLNLPSAPLAGHPQHPAKPVPLATCIALYKAGEPLPYGCPINTPELAYKVEMQVCIDLFRAGKRLKTWCPADTPKRAAAESSTPAAASSTSSH
jgi:hypothetical protein